MRASFKVFLLMKYYFLKIFRSPILYLALIAVGFFFVYSYPRIILPVINLSPDENANYYFTRLFAEKNTLMSYESLNERIEPIVHPRSVNVNSENYLVPGSFLGIILIYGFLAKFFGANIIIFLTPFFACIGGLFFYGIIKRVFSWKIAFISSCLMFSHPAFWYYSTRSMFHNALFVSLFIMGIFFLISLEEIKNFKLKFGNFNAGRIIFLVLSGLFVGAALIVRTAESPWVLGTLFIMWIFYFKRVKFFEVILILAMMALPFIPVGCYNQSLYGSPFLTGYANLNNGTANIEYFAQTDKLNTAEICANENSVQPLCVDCSYLGDGMHRIEVDSQTPDLEYVNYKTAYSLKRINIKEKIKKIITENIPASFTLNLNLRTAARNFKNYYLKFFEWLSALTLFGVIFFMVYLIFNILAKRYCKLDDKIFNKDALKSSFSWKKRFFGQFLRILEIISHNNGSLRGQFVYLLLFVFISAYLIIYYGSWVFYDAPNPNLITIGTSYTRYWLPVYIMGIPFIGFLFVRISDVLKFRLPKFIFLFIISAMLIAYSALFVYYAPYEGIKTQFNGFVEYNYKKEKVLELTEENAIIIGSYYDKIFFPYRRVITSKLYDEESVKRSIPTLLKRAPVYYYSFGLKKKDIDFINRAHLADYGVKLAYGKNIFKDEWLWRIVRIEMEN
ncbi:MAG: hypothetical protein V1891_02400 [bacterium]